MLQATEGVRDWDVCTVTGCRGAALGDGGACLSHADPDHLDQHLARLRRGRGLDARGVNIGGALLDAILAAAPVDDAGRRRLVGVKFEAASFECDVHLDDASFGRDTSFDGARFVGRLSLAGTVFEGPCRFAGTRFDSDATFDGARFASQAWFTGAVFSAWASFDSAVFDGPAWFGGASFARDVAFDGATFAGHARFDQVIFGGGAGFTGAVFDGDAEFRDATFARPPVFAGATFNGRQGIPAVGPRRQARLSGAPLASWLQRALAFVLDAFAPAALGALGVGAGVVLMRQRHRQAGVIAVVVGGLAALVWTIGNLVAQGRSGHTVGKQRVGLRLVGMADGQPVGPGRSILRQLLHVVDTAPALVGWLWPLADSRRQTFADKVMRTVVVADGDARSGPGAGTILVVAVMLVAVVAAGVVNGFPRWSTLRSAFESPGPRPTPAGKGGNAAVPASAPVAANTPLSLADAKVIAGRVTPGIVNIAVRMGSMGTFAGTGMVLTASGEVVTNDDVVDFPDGGEISVQIASTGKFYTARVVGTDRANDVAVLKLDNASRLATVQLGDSKSVTLKQPVIVVGNADGTNGAPTVTSGTVDGLNVTETVYVADGTKPERLSGLVHAHVVGSPGDSGGALANAAGEVIGMVTDTNPPAASGVSSDEQVAIPINHVVALAAAIEAAKGGASR